MHMEKAAIWSLLAGYLLLPSGLTYDLPGLPALDKNSATVLSTLVMCLAKGGVPPRAKVGLLLPVFAVAFVLAPILTSFGNSYELRIGNL